MRLQQRQARETGICPVRRELYSQCFGMTLFFLHHFYLMITQPGDYFLPILMKRLFLLICLNLVAIKKIELSDYNSYPKMFFYL